MALGAAAWPGMVMVDLGVRPARPPESMSLSLLLETDIRDKVLKRAFRAAARVVAERDFKDDGYLRML